MGRTRTKHTPRKNPTRATEAVFRAVRTSRQTKPGPEVVGPGLHEATADEPRATT